MNKKMFPKIVMTCQRENMRTLARLPSKDLVHPPGWKPAQLTSDVKHRLAHKSSSKSAKRERAPCLEARSAIVRARASVPGLFNEKRASDFEKVYIKQSKQWNQLDTVRLVCFHHLRIVVRFSVDTTIALIAFLTTIQFIKTSHCVNWNI